MKNNLPKKLWSQNLRAIYRMGSRSRLQENIQIAFKNLCVYTSSAAGDEPVGRAALVNTVMNFRFL
jgi:hypothetical protein